MVLQNLPFIKKAPLFDKKIVEISTIYLNTFSDKSHILVQ